MFIQSIFALNGRTGQRAAIGELSAKHWVSYSILLCTCPMHIHITYAPFIRTMRLIIGELPVVSAPLKRS